MRLKHLHFFSITPNVSSTMGTTCKLIGNIGAGLSESNVREKKQQNCKSVPRQNRAEMDLNAIDITAHAHTSTPMHAHVCSVHCTEYKSSIQKHIWPLVMHIVEVKTRESFVLCQVRHPLELYTSTLMFRVCVCVCVLAHSCSCVSNQMCSSVPHKISV